MSQNKTKTISLQGPCDEFKSLSKSDKRVQDKMAAAENYFKIEFKTLLENYQEGFEQNATPGKENGVDFKCPDCQFRSQKETVMKKHMRKLHEKRFKWVCIHSSLICRGSLVKINDGPGVLTSVFRKRGP